MREPWNLIEEIESVVVGDNANDDANILSGDDTRKAWW
jgi:hypothetical protein